MCCLSLCVCLCVFMTGCKCAACPQLSFLIILMTFFFCCCCCFSCNFFLVSACLFPFCTRSFPPVSECVALNVCLCLSVCHASIYVCASVPRPRPGPSFPLVAVSIMSPPPAFVTLLNGDQAQDAIRSLHHSTVRGRLINVALQPTDSLLCLTNLPHTFTAQEFEELVRAYGNIERSFLVYSELTGHSKGYGFVEYMKKDSASRARSELLGRPLVCRSYNPWCSFVSPDPDPFASCRVAAH